MEVYKLDRIEDGIVAIENPEGIMLYIQKEKLPEEAKIGDCFVLQNGVFVPAPEETKIRRSKIKSLLDEILSKN